MPFAEGDIDLIQTGDTEFELAQTVTYIGKEQTFVVPKGEGTDLASVPIGLSWLIPRYGRYTRAAILHDYLWGRKDISKSDADGIFRRVLRELDVSLLRRWTMWAAVRLASIFCKKDGAKGTPLKHWLTLAILWPLLIAYIAVPTVVVYTFTYIFKFFEWVIGFFEPS